MVGSVPIDGPLKVVDCLRRQLYLAVARRTTPQVIQVALLECKSCQIGELWWLTKLAQRKIVGELLESIEVGSEFEEALRSGIDVDSAKDENFIWRWRLQDRCDCFSRVHVADLFI